MIQLNIMSLIANNISMINKGSKQVVGEIRSAQNSFQLDGGH